MTSPLVIRIITHNIRYATTHPEPGELPWARRLPGLASHLRFNALHRDTIICLQEVLHGQLLDIHNAIGREHAEWSHVGVGRDDGRLAGEFNPILYRSRVWSVLRHDTKWLSPVPKEKGWDAASKRLVEIVHFRHQPSGAQLVVMNTHLDDQGFVARRESARMLRHLADDWTRQRGTSPAAASRLPLVLTGDLNSEAEDEPYQLLEGFMGGDVSRRVAPCQHYGYTSTFTGFQGREQDAQRLDYIFAGPRLDGDDLWGVQLCAVLPNVFEDSVRHSDHRAVAADLELHHTTACPTSL